MKRRFSPPTTAVVADGWAPPSFVEQVQAFAGRLITQQTEDALRALCDEFDARVHAGYTPTEDEWQARGQLARAILECVERRWA